MTGPSWWQAWGQGAVALSALVLAVVSPLLGGVPRAALTPDDVAA